MINIGNRIVNTYLYKVEEGYVMIDTGYKNDYKKRKKKLLKHNILLDEIKYIFLTHAHDDHAGFLNEILNENKNIKVIMNKEGISTLRRGQNSFEGGCSGIQSYLFCMLMKLMGNSSHKFPAIEKENEKQILYVDDENKKEIETKINGKIIMTKGHTNDSMSLLTNNGNLFCGDAAMNGFPSRNKIIIWINNIEEYEKSWDKIIKLNPKRICPSHGNSFKVDKLIKNKSKIAKRKLIVLNDK